MGIPRGFGINTVDVRFPNANQQFDEYQALVVQQRAPGDRGLCFRSARDLRRSNTTCCQ